MTNQAIYPGSFDPITNGHIDIVKRARKLFDTVHIGVIGNPSKSPIFSLTERKMLIDQVFMDDPGVVVDSFEGLLVNFSANKNVFTIIRGLRAVSDFDFEFQMALTNRKLHEKIDTIFLMTDEKFSYLSSSIVKQVAQYDGEISSFVPKNIEKAIKEKFNHE